VRLGIASIWLVIAICGTAQAQVLSINESIQRSRVSTTLEWTKLTLGDQDIDAQGIQLQYDYSFSNRLFFEGFVSTAMTAADGALQSSFVGFGAYALYSFFGNCCEVHKTVSVDSRQLLKEEIPSGWLLLAGAGVDQYLLNGTKGVYSSTGFGVEVSALFPLGSYSGRVNLKSSQLTAGALSIPALFAGVGVVYSF
jgi:hypothetical protein